MQYVATLIADPARPRLTGDLADHARAVVSAAGAHADAIDWLSDGVACDIAFDADDPAAVREALVTSFADQPIDAVVQARAGRRKRLLVADMEATIIANEMVDDLAALVGVGDMVAENHTARDGW